MNIKTLLISVLLGLSIQSVTAKTFTACNNPWPPHIITKNSGMSVEIVQAAMGLAGHNIKLSLKLWHQCLEAILENREDVLIAVWKNADREKKLLFSDPYYESEVVLIHNPNKKLEYTSLSSLAGKNVGIIDEYFYWDEFQEATIFKKISSSSLITNLRKLKSGKIDVTLDDRLVAMHAIEDGGYDKNIIEIINVPVAKRDIYVAANIKNPKSKEIIEKFNAGLKQIKINQTYRKIIQKYDDMKKDKKSK
jgi:polar amino acid transport system substrate-binding protein